MRNSLLKTAQFGFVTGCLTAPQIISYWSDCVEYKFQAKIVHVDYVIAYYVVYPKMLLSKIGRICRQWLFTKVGQAC